MDTHELSSLLLRQFESKVCSTFFINGPPGAGKTHLLNELAENLPAYIHNMQVLGPYKSSFDGIHVYVLEDLLRSGYLNSQAPDEKKEDWHSSWIWLKDHLKVAGRQNFLILIRLNDGDFSNYEYLRSFFSSLRYMEHYWDNSKARLLVVVAGYWNHFALESYYRDIQLSFPYTTGVNYLVWNGISVDEVIALVSKTLDESVLPDAIGRLVYEITGGLPGAIIDVLSFIGTNNPSVPDVVTATRAAAEKGSYGKLLVDSWLKYPPAFTNLLRQLVLYRKFDTGDKSVLDLLIIAGVASRREVFEKSFIQTSSWYMELLLQNHANVLGLNTEELHNLQFDEFVPGLITFNLEAFEIINNIENLIRNFALARLFEQGGQDGHVLQNKVLRRKRYSPMNEDDDIHERAVDWRERSRKNGMDTTINPLIAYVSTGDLVELVREIAESGDPYWDDIVDAIEKISPIRDAVMHHQIIDGKNLESLRRLQVKIYNALNR